MSAGRMIRVVVLGLGLVLSSGSFASGQTVRFVDDDGPAGGDGRSWQTAYRFLQDALFEARRRGSTIAEIRVGQGRYTPDRDEGGHVTPGDLTASFELVNGVAVRGGYGGLLAPDPDGRDVALYETVLSGDLNGDDRTITNNCCIPNLGSGCNNSDCQVNICRRMPECCEVWDEACADAARDFCDGICGHQAMHTEDNSGHVVTAIGLDSTSVLDGFTISDGKAANVTPSNGGGMLVRQGSPQITRCTFRKNSAGFGAGLYNQVASPVVTDCVFDGNTGNWGAGMNNDEGSNPEINGCMFSENFAQQGGAMYNFRGSIPLVTGCEFDRNTAHSWGGAMVNSLGSNARLSGCTFRRNRSFTGGAISNFRAAPVIDGCRFSRNEARTFGGAVSNDPESQPSLSDCIFIGNEAIWGGGVFNLSSQVAVFACEFIGNSARRGGGLYNWRSDVSAVDCAFSGNHVERGDGGAFYNGEESHSTLVNCTVTQNRTLLLGEGGGLFNKADSTLRVTNCIVWGNTTGDGNDHGEAAQIAGETGAQMLVTYSCIQDDDPDDDSIPFGGEANGNIDDDPLFVDPLGPDGVAGTEDDDLRLMAGSPCIDAGDNEAVPADALDLDGDGDVDEPVPLDLDNLPRFVDDRRTDDTGLGECRIVDMGAFEFQGRMVPPQVVVLCHRVGGDGEEGRMIFVPEEAVAEHLAHGDRLGPCNGCGMRLMGDLNGDGALDGNDVSSFVDLLLGRPGGAQVLQPGGPDDATAFQNEAADVNADGVIDMADIGAMVECVLLGGC